MKMAGNRIRIYLLGAVLVSQLWGCTAEPVIDVEPQEARPVEVSIARPALGVPVSLTRAGGNATPEQLPAGATVRIAAYYLRKSSEGTVQPASFETSPPTYEATYEVGADGSLSPCLVDADGKKIAGTASALTVRGGRYDFYAVSPARSLQQASGDKYQITNIPHKEDVMTSFQRNVDVSAGSNIVTLNTFTRKCALIVFNVAPSPDNALPFDRLHGTSLILRKVSASGASLTAGEDTGISLTGGSSGTASEVTFSTEDFEPVSGSNPTGLNKAKGVILPKNNTAFDVSLTVVRDDETATLSATIDKQITFDPGKKYIFTLEVKNNESSLLMTVQNWTPVSFTDTGVGSPDPSRPTDPDIDKGTGTTITVARWDDMPWTGNGEIGKSFKIDESTLIGYYKQLSASRPPGSWSTHPPFKFDTYDIAADHGVTYTLSNPPAMTGSYSIQVQKTQRSILIYEEARAYCENLTQDGFDNWRLPVQIELYAMWDMCKGKDPYGNATDDEEASTIFGAKFDAVWYWSASPYSSYERKRCGLSFNTGNFDIGGDMSGNRYGVRCVRDKKINISPPLTTFP